MKSITQNKRYCTHEITTKIYSVSLCRQTKDISFVCRIYKISQKPRLCSEISSMTEQENLYCKNLIDQKRRTQTHTPRRN